MVPSLVGAVDWVVGAVLGLVVAVVGAAVDWVEAVVSGIVSVELFPRQAVIKPRQSTKHIVMIANFFMDLPPVIQITGLVLPLKFKLDRKKPPFFMKF
jgi:hypothetical protein